VVAIGNVKSWLAIRPDTRSGFLFEQRFEFGPSVVGHRGIRWFTRSTRDEIFAEVCSILVHHALGLWFATLIVEGGIVKITIETDVERTTAFGAHLPKTDPLSKLNVPSAVKTVHQFTPTKWLFLRLALRSSGVLPEM
jgi:hypothetical protein